MIQLRRAQQVDVDAIYAIEDAAGYSHWSLKQIQQTVASHRVLVLVADDRLVAFAAFSEVLDEAELLNIVVAPGNQGRGYGFKLLNLGLEQLESSGITRCFLEVGDDNNSAIHLYEKLGFVRQGRRKGYYRKGDTAVDALIYAKELTG